MEQMRYGRPVQESGIDYSKFERELEEEIDQESMNIAVQVAMNALKSKKEEIEYVKKCIAREAHEIVSNEYIMKLLEDGRALEQEIENNLNKASYDKNLKEYIALNDKIRFDEAARISVEHYVANDQIEKLEREIELTEVDMCRIDAQIEKIEMEMTEGEIKRNDRFFCLIEESIF
ncbi:hypothetical protein ACOME3_004351 [Neoechinorhynchus agilis]